MSAIGRLLPGILPTLESSTHGCAGTRAKSRQSIAERAAGAMPTNVPVARRRACLPLPSQPLAKRGRCTAGVSARCQGCNARTDFGLRSRQCSAPLLEGRGEDVVRTYSRPNPAFLRPSCYRRKFPSAPRSCTDGVRWRGVQRSVAAIPSINKLTTYRRSQFSGPRRRKPAVRRSMR